MLHSEQPEGLETLIDFIRWGASRFERAGLHYGHGTDNALDEARFLAFSALKLPWNLPERYWHSRLTLAERAELARLFDQRIETRKPAAYLVGEAWFAGLRFKVNEHVLVPRSPIAELIERQFDGWVDPEAVTRVLDLCTGSGCIGIASLQALPHARVDLADISPEALEVARENVVLHGLEGRAEVIHSDLFSALEGRRYDLILSNPPYVDAIEMAHLPPEYRQEPELGLAAGEDGLDLVRKMLADAKNYLTDNGVLIVEVGVSWMNLVEAYPELPFYWFEFERGGEGVFALNRSELEAFDDILQARREGTNA
ncbi:50S ribosomal protein L3 N(5)-glutamine methyltransferase [Sulfurivirga sp.]|uniref:50S ribosomal protein L3 N(5)-glutamine methyltransferase n=1 Tax=Sulfurivirga sp. TaxID=2614236 RepID=UPI0025D648B4|nr:50S ribosomal protein L3 N(5)-glutamine methyltransferase [Sulfurivirga sp.]